VAGLSTDISHDASGRDWRHAVGRKEIPDLSLALRDSACPVEVDVVHRIGVGVPIGARVSPRDRVGWRNVPV
jgi:hypothetical protein